MHLKKILDAMTAPRKAGRHLADEHAAHPPTASAHAGYGNERAGQAGGSFSRPAAEQSGATDEPSRPSSGDGSTDGAAGAAAAGSSATGATGDAHRAHGPTPDAQGTTDKRWDAADRARRRGLALTQLLEHLPTDHLHDNTAATVLITTRLEDLREMLRRAGYTDTGHPLSPGEVRRAACSAGLIPAVLGTASVPINLGRSTRLFTSAQKGRAGNEIHRVRRG